MGGVNLATAYVRIIPTVEGIQGSLGRMFGDAGDQAGSDFNRGFGGSDPGGQAGESFLGGLKGKAMLGVAGIAAAAGAVFVDAYNEAVDRRQSEAKAQASLGISPEQAKALGGIAGRLYSQGYGEGLGELTDQVASVQSSLQNLKLPDAQLERITAKAISFGQAFDTDVADSVQSVGTLVQSGLVTDVDKAFDLITKSSQKVPAALRGDILASSDEYSQFFRTLGFSGDQAFDALVKGAEKGTFGIDKTGDAIKEFTIRSTDMSASSVAAYQSIGLSADDMSKAILSGGDTANSAFQRIVDGILNIQDPTTQANTAIALFGTQMEDLNVADVPEFLSGLKGMSGSLGDVAGAADQMDTAMGSTTDKVTLFWRNIKTNIVDFISDKVLPVITDATSWIGERLGPAIQFVAAWLGDHLGPVVQKAGAFFRDDLVPFIQLAVAWFEENLLPTVLRVGEFIGSTIDNIATVLGGIIDFVAGIFTGDWSRAWDGVKAIFGGIWDQITNIASTAWDVLTAIGGKILDWLSGLPGWAWERIQAFAGFLVEKGGQFLQWIWDGITTKAEEVWAWFTSLPQTIWSKVTDFVGASGQWVIDRGSEFIGWLTSGITTGASDLWNWFIGLPAKAWEILVALKDGVVKIGKDFVTWIVDGIKGAAQAVADAISSLFNVRLNDDGTGYIASGLGDPGVTQGGTARGGVIPGRDPGRRDNVLGRLPSGAAWGLRSEEAVMVPEFTRQVGGAPGVHRLNRLAEAGRIGELMGGFAWGGVVPKAKEIGKWVSDGIAASVRTDDASSVWDHIGDDARSAAGKSSAVDVDPGSARGRFIQAMLSKQGTSYVWGAAGPDVFDCSGLVSWALEQAGVGKGRLTAEGFNSSFPRAPEAPGNLVTFDTGRIPGKAGHIGAIVDVARGLMMHTDGAGPARVSDYKSRDGGPLNVVDAIGGGAASGSSNPFTGILSKVKGFIVQAFNNAVGPSGESAPGGSGVERWRSLGLDVLDKVGKYRGLSLTQYIDRMLNQIRTESSGDPNAINLTDINAQRGDPSIGLLQVIGSTFRSALRGTPFEYLIAAGQRDPRASLTSSTLYSLNRYGSLDRAWRGVAYDQGGWLMPGGSGINLLNQPEAVLTPPQSQALLAHAAALEAGWWGGSPPITVNNYIDGQQLDARTEIIVDRELRSVANAIPA